VCLLLRNLQLFCYIAHSRSHVTVICRSAELFSSGYTKLCVATRELQHALAACVLHAKFVVTVTEFMNSVRNGCCAALAEMKRKTVAPTRYVTQLTTHSIACC
jgi:hypothetical protein